MKHQLLPDPAAEAAFELPLRVVDVPLLIRTNDADVWTALTQYYAPYRMSALDAAATVVTLLHGPVRPEGDFDDVVRGSGKRVKEAVRDLDGGRLILKRATGVLMGLWPGLACAAGDLRANLNQAINLVNACYAKRVMDRGYRLLHAAGVSRAGRGVVLAGVAGAGKSTAALHLVEAGFRFLSNDRVLIKGEAEGVDALGYPKQPRVNPGTLLHHPRLASLLKPEERQALESLPGAALWQLEDKRDVDLDVLYGSGTVQLRARVALMVLLTWRLDGTGFQVQRLDPESALARWAIYHKDLGVFDLDRAPASIPTDEALNDYRALMGQVTVVEVRGRPDFTALVRVVDALLAA